MSNNIPVLFVQIFFKQLIFLLKWHNVIHLCLDRRLRSFQWFCHLLKFRSQCINLFYMRCLSVIVEIFDSAQLIRIIHSLNLRRLSHRLWNRNIPNSLILFWFIELINNIHFVDSLSQSFERIHLCYLKIISHFFIK